ncbi:MAG: HEAT repeat domain-containing protein [Elusimicrobia bacterium]|nr:HEAT repeat domain-containing protein [Elusimicrobiota bacterium]
MFAEVLLVLAVSGRAQIAPFQVVPVIRKLGGPAYVRKPTKDETKLMADEIERRLAALDQRLKDENAEFDRESLSLAGAMPEKDLARVLAKYPKAPLFLELTILSRRLQAYQETGELPADIPDKDAIRELLEKPWEKSAPMPELETDIVKLEAQVARYARLMEPKLAAPKPAPEKPLPEAPAVENDLPAPPPPVELAADAGRGREAVDPVPALLNQLFSPDPRQRALAADELAQHGAREAVTPLTSALDDLDARVRSSAALALGALGPLPPESLEALGFALKDRNPDVRLSARTALERLK